MHFSFSTGIIFIPQRRVPSVVERRLDRVEARLAFEL